MSVSYDDSRVWSNIDELLKDQLLLKLISVLECLVCSDIMHVPFLASCGHSFCYSCLNAWFDNKVNCPTCRTELEQPPILNLQLKDMSRNITDMVIDTMEDNVHRKELDDARQGVLDEHENCKSNLFGDAFKSALTLIDNSDGVPRCGNCHWEAHGSVCLHCGTTFRVPRNDLYYDSEDGDAYNEDQNEVELYGIAGQDEYDSNDSFLDTRDVHLINHDLDSEQDDLLSSSDDRWMNEAASDWNGAHSLSGESDQWDGFDLERRDSVVLNTNDLEEAVNRIHGRDVGNYIDVSSDEDSDPVARPGRRARVYEVDLDSD